MSALPVYQVAYMLCSLAQAKTALNTDTTSAADYDELYKAGIHASARLQAEFGDPLAPIIGSLSFDNPDGEIVSSGLLLYLHAPLVSVTSMADPNGDAIATANYKLLPRNRTPKTSVLFDALNSLDPTFDDALTITGTWCYHTDYANAFSAGSTVSTDSGATMTVASGSAFTVGQLLKCESEFMAVTAVSNNTLTLARGANGSTQATHANGVAVNIYNAPSIVSAAAAMYTAYLYKNRGAFQQVTFDGLTTVQYPPDLPTPVRNALMGYRVVEGQVL